MAPSQAYELPTHTDRGLKILYISEEALQHLGWPPSSVTLDEPKKPRFITNNDLVPLHKRGRK